MAESGKVYDKVPAGATWDADKNQPMLNGEPITIQGVSNQDEFDKATKESA